MTGFDQLCTSDDLMQHMQHNEMQFKFVKKILCKDEYRASFKFAVSFLAYEHAFCLDSWPPRMYTCIRKCYS